MSRTSRTAYRFARLLAVLWLCLATPAVQDILMDAVTWATGEEPCGDDCEQTGTCTQQCGHCVCSVHAGLLPQTDRLVTEPVCVRVGALAPRPAMAQRGHLDPPFRPPVS